MDAHLEGQDAQDAFSEFVDEAKSAGLIKKTDDKPSKKEDEDKGKEEPKDPPKKKVLHWLKSYKDAPKINKLNHWWERLFSFIHGGRDVNGINYDANGNPQGVSANKLEFSGAINPAGELALLSELSALSVEAKLTNYVLNFEHVKGATKAVWFEKALGFTQTNMKELAEQLVFDASKAVQTEVTQYGTKFNQIISVTGANGKIADVLTAWIKTEDNVIRLVTAYPAK